MITLSHDTVDGLFFFKLPLNHTALILVKCGTRKVFGQGDEKPPLEENPRLYQSFRIKVHHWVWVLSMTVEVHQVFDSAMYSRLPHQ